jgi:D-alanyl-D-alanine dipeptidase
MKYVYFLTVFVVLLACGHQNDAPKVTQPEAVEKINKNLEIVMDQWLLDSLGFIGLVDVAKTDPRILIDLRYASSNNFMGRQLYDTLISAFLQKEVMSRLSKCQDLLDSIRPGYKLKIFDAVRPLGVQREMWEALDSVPMYRRGKFVSNPLFGSVHNFGSAVDITICDTKGVELDMGAGYDDFREIAFPSKESYFLQTGELNRTQYQNRILLRKVMYSQKFSNIPSEWWHFNAYSRPTAERKFQILLDESGNHKKWTSPVKKLSQDSAIIN